MNRPGYQQMLDERYLRLKERERQKENQGFELPGQDQDYQPYMLPVAFEQGIGEN